MANALLPGAPPPVPTGVDFTQYLGVAAQQIDQGTDDVYNAETNAAKVQQDNLNQQAENTGAQISTVQKQYADLSKEFGVEQSQETGVATQQGQAGIGAAEVGLAKAGIDQGSGGAFAAPVAQAKNDFTQAIAGIADKYGAKQQDLTDTLTANVQQLEQQAQSYTSQGNQVMADLATTIAGQKQQQQQQITSLAQSMASAQTVAEQDAWKDYMDLVTAQHEEDTLQLSEETLANTERHESVTEQLSLDRLNQSLAVPTITKNSFGGLEFASKTGEPVTAADYAKATGQSIASILSQSSDPTDKAFLKDYQNAQKQVASGDSTTSQANAALAAEYPDIVGTTTLF